MTVSGPRFPLPPGGLVVPVDKPVGPTSHDIVSRARKALNTRKVGHTGTLDPFASGLLLLCAGDATRLSRFLTGRDKAYDAVAVLGVTTDSHDLDGEVTATSDAWQEVTREAVEAALAGLRGEIEQRPPALSAKKVRGESAHRRVRRGESVELDPVRVHISRLELVELDLPRIRFRVRCSSGTYVRGLARDVGAALGTGAHLVELRRTRVGIHGVEGALPGTLDTPVDPAACLTPLEALGDFPVRPLDDDEARLLVQGRRIPRGEILPGSGTAAAGDAEAAEPAGNDPAGAASAPEEFVAAARGDDLLAILRLAGDELQPVTVFPGVLESPVR